MTVSEERFIRVPGSINLRDFGGYRTADGRRVREGLLFRCGLMTGIEERAYDDFARLGIGVICDLRSHEEVERSPTPDHPVFDCQVHIPIWPGSSNRFQETVRERQPDENDFIEFMSAITREIVRDHPGAYRRLMEELLGADRGFLLHCSAGKDRTGVGVAIILSVLGCDEETIMGDYLASNLSADLAEHARRRIAEESAQQSGQQSGQAGGQKGGLEGKAAEMALRALSSVRAEYLQGAFEEIEASYGGMDGYLEALGVTGKEQAELRARLLVG